MIAEVSGNDEIREAIAVDIAGGIDAAAGDVARALAIDDKAAVASCDGREVDGSGVGFAEDHIGAPGVCARWWIAAVSRNDEISEAITIDVTSTGHAVAALVSRTLPIDHKATAAFCNGGQINGGSGGCAKDHIGAACVGAGGWIAEISADDQIRQPVTVDITSGGNAVAAEVARGLAIDDKAAVACCDGGEVDGGGVGFAEDHIGAPGTLARCRIAFEGTNDQISEAIAVDITGGGDPMAVAVARALPIDDEAASACCDGGEIDGGDVGFAEDHIEATGVGARFRVAETSAHEEIREAIAVDIAGTGAAATAFVENGFTIDDEAAVACSDSGEIDGSGVGFAEDHIGATGIGNAGWVAVLSAYDEIREAIAVDITG